MSEDPSSTPPSPGPPSPGPHTAGGGRWQPPSPAELETKLPQYRILEVLGVGGMGAVYKGFQTSLERYVAIKILSPGLTDEDMQYAGRFKQEAKTMARLSHPGIVGVFDFGETADGLYYIVMEYVEGTDVQQMVNGQGRLEPGHALAVAMHVCDALAYAHRHGIIHRDIKPANVMVDTEGRVKVADFGLAKGVQPGSSLVTGTGKAMGTPDFVAPESLIIGMEVDQRADLYSLGVMLYQMLTGKVPRGRFEDASVRVPGLDPRYDAVVDRAMREDREARYSSAEDLRADLTAIHTVPLPQRLPAPTQQPASARPPRPQPSVRSAPAKSGAAPALIGIIAAVVIAAALLFWKPWETKESAAAAQAAPVAMAQPVRELPRSQPAPDPRPPPREAPPEDSRPPAPPHGGAGDPPGSSSRPPRREGEPPPRGNPPQLPRPAPVAVENERRPAASNPPVSVPVSVPAINVPPSELDQRLAALDQSFQAAAEREVEKTCRDFLASLDKSYGGALDRALAGASQAGNTDEALALREEKQRMEKGGGVPGEAMENAPDDKTPETLKALRMTYRASRAARDLERIRNLQPLFEKYGQALAALTLELTRAGRLDDAVRVRKVAEEIASRAEAGGASMAKTSSVGAVVTTSGGKTKLSGLERGFSNRLGMKFVPVPGTKVLFCIHETRRRDYAAYAAANPGVNEAWKTPKRDKVRVGTGSEDDPVVAVSWDDAVAFCAWLSKREGLVYRLPTDREWSFAVGIAARESPASSPVILSGRIKGEYPWGNQWPPPKGSGNYQDEAYKGSFPQAKSSVGYNDGFATLAPVMSFKPNNLGIYDLAGNAWEWCDDWGDESHKGRVCRGGSWSTVNLLSSSRDSVRGDFRVVDRGFRCVVQPD